jgi:hypothetical protein
MARYQRLIGEIFDDIAWDEDIHENEDDNG